METIEIGISTSKKVQMTGKLCHELIDDCKAFGLSEEETAEFLKEIEQKTPAELAKEMGENGDRFLNVINHYKTRKKLEKQLQKSTV